ncbi:MAG: porin [Halorhodospira sp.]
MDLQASLDWFRDKEQDEIVPADDNDRGAFSGAVRYRGERLWVAGGYERVSGLDEPPEARPESSAEGYRLAMAVEVTDAWRVTALGQATHDAYETGAQAYSDAVAYGAGTRYALEDDLDLRAHCYALDVDASGYGAELFSIGPVYHASEQLQLYATASYLDNDDRSKLVPWRLGRTAGPPGEDPEIGPGRAAWGVSFRGPLRLLAAPVAHSACSPRRVWVVSRAVADGHRLCCRPCRTNGAWRAQGGPRAQSLCPSRRSPSCRTTRERPSLKI